MKDKERWISVCIICCLLVGAMVWGTLQQQPYQMPQVQKPSQTVTTDLSQKAIQRDTDFQVFDTGVTNYQQKTIWVDQTFTTHLPLVVIDTEGQVPKKEEVWDDTKQCHVPTGKDTYAYGNIAVIDSKDGVHTPKDTPVLQSDCKLKIRGNTSAKYDKKQYRIKLLHENGHAKKADLFDMGRDDIWILNISLIDASLLRNYLAYMCAGELMPDTPDVQYCEVLWKAGAKYAYQGVYMMMEGVTVGKHRVRLPKHSKQQAYTPALLRRDRYHIQNTMLENDATKKGLTAEYLGVEYPKPNEITQTEINAITTQVNRLENALYADTWEEFVQYRAFVDMQSFVDYFIINEFFLNYDAGYHSTYCYLDGQGQMHMGPVWDFDQAINPDAKLDTTAFHDAPWFDGMLQDPLFTEKIIQRYHTLRQSILSDASIQQFVEETVAYLGQAIVRDWNRWGYVYTYPTQTTYAQEVTQILSVLSQHGAWLDTHMDSLYQFQKISLEDAKAEQNNPHDGYMHALAVVFVVLFFVSVKLVLQHQNE